MAVWLLTFSAVVDGRQSAVLAGRLDASQARQIAATVSISGALIHFGGAAFMDFGAMRAGAVP